MRTEEKKARTAARKRREAWMAEVNERWAAFLAQRVARPDVGMAETAELGVRQMLAHPNLMGRELEPVEELLMGGRDHRPVARAMAVTT